MKRLTARGFASAIETAFENEGASVDEIENMYHTILYAGEVLRKKANETYEIGRCITLNDKADLLLGLADELQDKLDHDNGFDF